MKTRLLFAAALVAALPATHTAYAATTSFSPSIHAMFAKEKTVKLSLRNTSSAPIDLRVGENLMTLAAGQSLSLTLPVGTRIVANSSTAAVQAGTLIAEVSKELSGAVLNLK